MKAYQRRTGRKIRHSTATGDMEKEKHEKAQQFSDHDVTNCKQRLQRIENCHQPSITFLIFNHEPELNVKTNICPSIAKTESGPVMTNCLFTFTRRKDTLFQVRNQE